MGERESSVPAGTEQNPDTDTGVAAAHACPSLSGRLPIAASRRIPLPGGWWRVVGAEQLARRLSPGRLVCSWRGAAPAGLSPSCRLVRTCRGWRGDRTRERGWLPKGIRGWLELDWMTGETNRRLRRLLHAACVRVRLRSLAGGAWRCRCVWPGGARR